MHNKYQAKHYNGNLKFNIKSKMLICMILLVIFVFQVMSGILSYFVASTSITNSFTIAGTYTVHFNANGGTGTMDDQKIFLYSDTNLNSNEFTKEGYLFDGWNTLADGTGTSYTNGQSVRNLTTENSVINLYAQWEEIVGVAEIDGTYYLTLQEAIDAVPDTKVETEIKLLCDVSENVSVAKNKNIVLNLQTHTLINNTDDNINVATIENNGLIKIKNGTVTKHTTPAAAVINNYNTGQVKIENASIIATGTDKSQAVYNNGGKLEITGTSELSSQSTNRATVHNLANGTVIVTGGTITSQSENAINNASGSITIGTNDGILDNNSPIIQGFKNAINTSNDNIYFYDGVLKGKTNAVSRTISSTNIESGCKIVNGTEQIDGVTYKTQQLEPNIIVTLDPNGGQVQPNVKYLNSGDQLGALPTPTRNGYKFDGWYTEAEEGVEVTGEETINGNITYYAHWSELEIVTFNPTGGNCDVTEKYIENGEELGTLPVPQKAGNRFLGWFTEPNGGTQITENTVITGNITYYAHWQEVGLVTFNPNGGTVAIGSREVDKNTAIGELPIPTKTQNQFVGWFTEQNGGTQITENTIITEDITVYAHWTGIDVARVNGVDYATLQDAINAVPTTNVKTTVELLTDISEGVTIALNQNILFDFNNNTLRNKGNVAVITNNGTVEITNGTLTSSADTAAINNNDKGILKISGGDLQTTGTRQVVYNKGIVEITGDAYLCSTATGTPPDIVLERATVQNLNKATAIITGGTIIGVNQQAISNEGTLTIGNKEDGTISTSSPIITGKTCAIKNINVFNFYDGHVRSVNNMPIDGLITDTPEGYDVTNTTETEDGVTYNVAEFTNVINIPTAITELKYNRQAQTGVLAKDSVYTITGNTATQAGTYTATASLKYPSTTTWEDGTNTDKTIPYTIEKVIITPEAIADNKVYDGTTDATGTIKLNGIVKGDNITATAIFTFASPDIGTGITVTATNIAISGSNVQNYQLSTTTAETTADITDE